MVDFDCRDDDDDDDDYDDDYDYGDYYLCYYRDERAIDEDVDDAGY